LGDIPPADHPYEFVAGALALDFTNTVGGTHSAPTHEHLQSYADLVLFARQAGALDADEARRLGALAERRSSQAKAVLRRAIKLRESAWRVFSALAMETEPAPEDLSLLSREVAEAQLHSEFVRHGDGYRFEPRSDGDLERLLWPIARSAYDLLTSEHDIRWVRECASDTCEWLFVDRSKSHTRRWCDMNDCGNRAKQKRLRQRASRTKSAR
jgi:predicted RNA-binding Zn ribbon-like protein